MWCPWWHHWVCYRM